MEERAADGFTNLDDVMAEELEAIARAYKRTAGFSSEDADRHLLSIG